MPAPKLTQEQWEEVKKRYVAGETATALGAEYGVTKGTVCRQLAKRGVTIRHYSPYTEKAIPCPYTRDRLYEMYWREGMSFSEIGRHAAEVLGREAPVFQKTVQDWFRAAGLGWRNLHEAQKNRVRKHPEQFTASVEALRRKRPDVKAGHFPKHVTRMGVRAARKRNLARRITRRCQICGVEITRSPGEFNAPAERTACSYVCAGKLRARLRRDAERQAQIEALRTPKVIPDWLQEILNKKERNQ